MTRREPATSSRPSASSHLRQWPSPRSSPSSKGSSTARHPTPRPRSFRALREPLVLGLGAGIISGLFGVGGGVVMVPGLVLWLGFGPHKAHATSLAAIVAAAAAGMTPFAAAGDVEWTAVPVLLAGSAFGAFAGARLLGRVSALWLTRAFVVLLLFTAVRLALE